MTQDSKSDSLKAIGGPEILRAVGGPIVPRFAGGDGPEFVGGRRVVGMGWQPDVPDIRDFTLGSERISKLLRGKKSKLMGKASRLPAKVDHRHVCSPVEDQGSLGACTAHAVIGMMEYMMRRSKVNHVDGSRLFLYKVTRKLLGWTGDTGAYLRSTMQGAVIFGVPPEKLFPYEIKRYEEEPSAFLYAYASNYQALNYTRLDVNGQSGGQTLGVVKRILAAGYAAAFGFPVYSSLSSDAHIPFPEDHDSLLGGHAVLAVGYDDAHMVGSRKVPSLIIRNSWGPGWGEEGYGYLPYQYIEEELALDFWAVFKAEWIDPGVFG